MAKVATSSTTFTDEDDRVHVDTMHTIHGYTLIRRTVPAEDHATWAVRSPSSMPRVKRVFDTTPEAPTYGVNWSARGTLGSVDARVYAALITIAADVVDAFNRIVAEGN